jgi:hypothetical protein
VDIYNIVYTITFFGSEMYNLMNVVVMLCPFAIRKLV